MSKDLNWIINDMTLNDILYRKDISRANVTYNKWFVPISKQKKNKNCKNKNKKYKSKQCKSKV